MTPDARALQAARNLYGALAAIEDPADRNRTAQYLFGKDYASICWRLQGLPSTPPPPLVFEPEPIDRGSDSRFWRWMDRRGW